MIIVFSLSLTLSLYFLHLYLSHLHHTNTATRDQNYGCWFSFHHRLRRHSQSLPPFVSFLSSSLFSPIHLPYSYSLSGCLFAGVDQLFIASSRQSICLYQIPKPRPSSHKQDDSLKLLAECPITFSGALSCAYAQQKLFVASTKQKFAYIQMSNGKPQEPFELQIVLK